MYGKRKNQTIVDIDPNTSISFSIIQSPHKEIRKYVEKFSQVEDFIVLLSRFVLCLK